ncbi:MAG: hypothetical protein ACTSRP_02390 [Candidatus Helarchaeota archaeon]
MDDLDFNITLGEVKGYWNWKHNIPLFRFTEGRGENWKRRLKEELEKLEILKKYGKEKIFFEDIILDERNDRIFHCLSNIKGKKIDIVIRLPVRYPKDPPLADFSVGPWAFPSEAGIRSACLGQIYSKWDRTGRMGVAHFVGMLGSYIALALHSISTPRVKNENLKRRKKH